ncbi:LLM class flavin-dependent oxidoreductase [Breoghania sp.]|uniref:LLM class flavin-dependent oxidoreductase n=1 Tax=Breoghania sp. TaxID=2065378 RepID=UPI002AAAE098|nr:LLM class flavin-dependent oxidoreductase [Breoghania sp.]
MKLSVLDLAFVGEGETPRDALDHSLELARHAEALGYERFWLAEHHNMIGIASAATSVVIGYIAGGTSTIRVGAGGIMLPNHSPLVIAEQFGTLETLYPGRIDLGLGRAPGTDQATLRALRRSYESAESFPQDVVELQALLAPAAPNQIVRAVPGAGTNVPIWMLGSSLFGAKLAAMLGLPYAFASHFAPQALEQAVAIYKAEFTPSDALDAPYVIAGANVFAADDDAQAARLATSLQMRFTGMLRGERGLTKPPIDDIETYWTPGEKRHVQEMMRCSFIGGPESLKHQLKAFADSVPVDEIIVSSSIYDNTARLHSYEILADVAKGIGG